MGNRLHAETQVRVVIVDDEPAVRHGLRRFLAADPGLQVVAEADRPDRALHVAKAQQPDLMLVDLSLRNQDGLTLLRALRQQGYPGRILVLSMHSESLYAEPALRAGADGYLMKADASTLLPEAMQTVLRGATFLSPSMQNLLLEQWDESGAAHVPAEFAGLHARLLRLLLRIAFSPEPVRMAVEDSDVSRLRAALHLDPYTRLTEIAGRFLREWLRKSEPRDQGFPDRHAPLHHPTLPPS